MVHKGLVSSIIGTLDGYDGFLTAPDKRGWSARIPRARGRDLLLVSTYLPPGGEREEERQAPLDDLNLLVDMYKVPFIIAGD